MATHRQVKKKSRGVSLTDEEFQLLLSRAEFFGFDRNEYILALIEAEQALGLTVGLLGHRKVLRLPEAASAYSVIKAGLQAAQGSQAPASQKTAGRAKKKPGPSTPSPAAP